MHKLFSNDSIHPNHRSRGNYGLSIEEDNPVDQNTCAQPEARSKKYQRTKTANITPLAQFGIIIKILRHKKKLDLPGLAEKTNIDMYDLVAIEMGEKSIRDISDLLPVLSKAFEVSESKLTSLLLQLIFDR